MRNLLQAGLTIFIVASLIIHLSLWTALKLAPSNANPKKQDKIEIVVLDKSREDQPVKHMQIVEQSPKPLNDETPEEARFLSAHNQRVVQETRARENGDFKNANDKQTTKASPSQKQMQAAAKKIAQPRLNDLIPQFDPTVRREYKAASHPNQEAQASAGQAAQQASQTNDHLKNMPPSLETLLNTREFVYYSYYQRIRTQIRQFWEPSIRGKVRRIFAQGRTIASEKDHVTRVIIVLDQNGGLLGVKVVGESGVKDLDEAAVEAFRAAEPFPNPPKGIVDPDGTIKINWDFILEANLDAPAPLQRYARSEW